MEPQEYETIAAAAPTLDLDIVESLRSMEMFDELVLVFLEELQARLGDLHNALHQADREALKDAAHTLKGSSAAIGATRLSALSAQLQRQCSSVASEKDAKFVLDINAEATALRQAIGALSS